MIVVELSVMKMIECSSCTESSEIMECANEGKLSNNLISILLPCVCNRCDQRFADNLTLNNHRETAHVSQFPVFTSNVQSMSKAALVAALKERGLDTRGNISILRTRLSGCLE